MTDTLSIKVVIAGRTYPLTIKRQEEEQVRKAAAQINDGVKKLQESYAVRDKQDLLAMIALQIALKSGSNANETVVENNNTDQVDAALDALLLKLNAVLK